MFPLLSMRELLPVMRLVACEMRDLKEIYIFVPESLTRKARNAGAPATTMVMLFSMMLEEIRTVSITG